MLDDYNGSVVALDYLEVKKPQERYESAWEDKIWVESLLNWWINQQEKTILTETTYYDYPEEH